MKQYAEFEEEGTEVHILKVFTPIHKKSAGRKDEDREKTEFQKYLLGEKVSPEDFLWGKKMDTTGVAVKNLRDKCCMATRTFPCQDMLIIMDAYGLYYLEYSNDLMESDIKAVDVVTDMISPRIFVRIGVGENYLRNLDPQEREKLITYFKEFNSDLEEALLRTAKAEVSAGTAEKEIEAILIEKMQWDITFAIDLAYRFLFLIQDAGLVQMYVLNNEKLTRASAKGYIKKAKDMINKIG